ncbi:MAG: hypothetical protein R3C20_12600 [Planctomycetaceae bacterium]
MEPTDLQICERILANLVQLAQEIDDELKGRKLSLNESFKSFKKQLEAVWKPLRADKIDDLYLTPAVAEAIAHLNGESGIVRSRWALEEALEEVRDELKRLGYLLDRN